MSESHRRERYLDATPGASPQQDARVSTNIRRKTRGQRSFDGCGDDAQSMPMATLSRRLLPTLIQRLRRRSANGYGDDQPTAMLTLSQRLSRRSVNGHTVARRRKKKSNGYRNPCIHSTHTPPPRSRQGLLFSTNTIFADEEQISRLGRQTTSGRGGRGGGETGCQHKERLREKSPPIPPNFKKKTQSPIKFIAMRHPS